MSKINEKNFFREFIDFCNSSALFGERNNNGSDSYTCPSCYSHIYIKGYCCSTEGIFAEGIKHEDDCKLVDMYNYALEQEKENYLD